MLIVRQYLIFFASFVDVAKKKESIDWYIRTNIEQFEMISSQSACFKCLCGSQKYIKKFVQDSIKKQQKAN